MAKHTTAHARRSRERGAALTESVVAIPVFIGLWWCSVYMHEVYAAKLSTQREARRASFAEALAGCPKGEQAGSGRPPRFDGTMDGDSENTYLVNDVGYTTGVASFSSPTASAGGFPATNVTTRFRVTCNQRRSDGSIGEAARVLFQGLESLVSVVDPPPNPRPAPSGSGPTPTPVPTPTPTAAPPGGRPDRTPTPTPSPRPRPTPPPTR